MNERPATIGRCRLNHGDSYVENGTTDYGYELPFCGPHMEALPKTLRSGLVALAGEPIFALHLHGEAVEFVARATAYLRAPARRDRIRGICRTCGCTDEFGCEGGCSWVDRAHTLCSSCSSKR